METIPDIAVFTAVIRHGSFSRAAEDLGLTKSAVSRRITRLESRLGVQLIQRSTRNLSLTEAGVRYYVHAGEALNHIQIAEEEAAQFGTELIGEIRLHAPMSFGVRHVAPLLPDFLARHPKLSIDLHLDDEPENPSEGRFDIALRAGDLPDSTQIVRRLAPLRSVICASPGYVGALGQPSSPAELAGRNCILFSYSDNRDEWEFRSPLGPQKVSVSGDMKVNNSEALSAALVAGAGIGRLPTFIAGPLIMEGRLVQLLSDYDMPWKPLYIVFSDRKLISRSARALIDFFVSAYDKEQPYWDTWSEARK